MSKYGKFGTALICIDGRMQNPVADWIKFHSQVQYVDMITAPGIIKILSEENSHKINMIFESLQVSVKFHQSQIIAVAGHFDCAANEADFEEQKNQIIESVNIIYSWNLGIRIVGLYVNEWSSVDMIADTRAEFKEIKSFL